MSNESLLAIERWRFIIAEIVRIRKEKGLDYFHVIQERLWAAENDLNNPSDKEVTFLRQEGWPLFIHDEIEKHGRLLRNDIPWLEEFETPRGGSRDFPKALEQFEHDPVSMTNVLSAFVTLNLCEVFKSLLLDHLRFDLQYMERVIPRVVVDETDGIKLSNDGWLKTPQKLRAEADDKTFLLQFTVYCPLAICQCYWWLVNHGDFAKDPRRQTIAERIAEFAILVAPEGKFNHLDLSVCVSKIRVKAYEKLSKSRADDRKEEIAQLKKENEQLKRDLQVHLRAVSDMSYRHLTEMLPIAYRVANKQPLRSRPQSGPDWQSLWQQIWAAAATKTDSPLHALHIQSDKRSRSQIQDDGNKLFGTLSANMHHFGQVYDPVKHLRDYVPGRILDALRLQEYTKDGDVDWVKEIRRFL